MSYTEKIDVLELLIDLLGEHENKLDTIIEQMEIIDQTINKDPGLSKTVKEYNSTHEEPTQSILVVDDDKNLANSFNLVLESVGYKVDVAYTGLQALYKVHKKDYDLVLLDINLPDMMGEKVAAEIEEYTIDTDIVFISGYSESQRDDKETLMKPIEPEKLIESAAKNLLHS